MTSVRSFALPPPAVAKPVPPVVTLIVAPSLVTLSTLLLSASRHIWKSRAFNGSSHFSDMV